jgi:hypothetical protein
VILAWLAACGTGATCGTAQAPIPEGSDDPPCSASSAEFDACGWCVAEPVADAREVAHVAEVERWDCEADGVVVIDDAAALAAWWAHLGVEPVGEVAFPAEIAVGYVRGSSAGAASGNCDFEEDLVGLRVAADGGWVAGLESQGTCHEGCAARPAAATLWAAPRAGDVAIAACRFGSFCDG